MTLSRIGVRTKIKRRSRMAWASLTVTPWCAALAMLVSFAADAGQDTHVESSQLFRLDVRPATPADLVPSSAGFGFRLPGSDAVLTEARLVVGDPAEFRPAADEIDPRGDLKPKAKGFPSVDRSHKGDPNVALRPTFDARLRTPGSLEAARGATLVFDDQSPLDRPTGFVVADGPAPGPDSVASFVPMPEGVTLTTAPASSAASPQQGVGATTPHNQDGSTPSVARASTLNSSTPAEGDATPVEIAALPKFSRGPNGIVRGNTTVVGISPVHPDYAALIDPDKLASEKKCLAEAIYFEARSEPEEGQAAVAQVVLNRVSSGLYPSSVCGVVFQNQQRHNACQFSFACEGKALHIAESEPWTRAMRVAEEVMGGAAYVSDVGGATHYHANYVRPFWASRLKKMDRIGHHVFYKLRPGQT